MPTEKTSRSANSFVLSLDAWAVLVALAIALQFASIC
jgi:hypothetical protein